MIVPMKHFDLVCVASEKEATIERLRSLGIAHLDLAPAAGESVAAAQNEEFDAQRAVRLILKARTAGDSQITRRRSVAEVLAIAQDRETLLAEKERLEREIRIYAPYGDFDPALARKLLEKGVDFSQLGDEGLPLPEKLPQMRLSKMQEKLQRVNNRIAIDDSRLACCDEKAIVESYPEIKDRIAFEQARSLLEDYGAVSVVSGWIPEPKVDVLMDEVTQRRASGLFERTATLGWGVFIRDCRQGETPPTLIEPPRLFRPVKVLFEGLGVSPGYNESDVSVPFMCYFSIFFAMLVGDGAYGIIFLIATIMLRRKLPKSWFVLLSVFSALTVVWGLLSNTWFGAGFDFCKDWPTVKWLADPSYNNMMLLCFTIGVSHLMLARLWNGICKLNDSTSIAEFGWAGILLTMYLLTNSIVGIFDSFPVWGGYLGGVSALAVLLFSVKPSELKSRGSELGMLPLSIMSSLGDVISYVRLFAVGLASVKVAENFNQMALDMVSADDSWWIKILMSVVMVAILVVGHALNLIMAALSILVHAVRLNTLEFSNHKGVTWSGYLFSPFKKINRPSTKENKQ